MDIVNNDSSHLWLQTTGTERYWLMPLKNAFSMKRYARLGRSKPSFGGVQIQEPGSYSRRTGTAGDKLSESRKEKTEALSSKSQSVS